MLVDRLELLRHLVRSTRHVYAFCDRGKMCRSVPLSQQSDRAAATAKSEISIWTLVTKLVDPPKLLGHLKKSPRRCGGPWRPRKDVTWPPTQPAIWLSSGDSEVKNVKLLKRNGTRGSPRAFQQLATSTKDCGWPWGSLLAEGGFDLDSQSVSHFLRRRRQQGQKNESAQT